MATARPTNDGHADTSPGTEMLENIRRAFPVPEPGGFEDLLRQIDESSSGLRHLSEAA